MNFYKKSSIYNICLLKGFATLLVSKPATEDPYMRLGPKGLAMIVLG